MTDSTIPVEVQAALIEQEIASYRNSIYIVGVRHRVAKRLADKERMEACATELEKLEQALDELQAILGELQQPANGKVKA
jgi:hypothetical protein